VFQPNKIGPEQLQDDTVKAHKSFYAFRNWWSNVPLTGMGTVLYRGIGWWLINRWEKQNRWFKPVLLKYLGKKAYPDIPQISRKIKAFKFKKLKPIKDNLMQIYLSKKDGTFYLQIKGVVNHNTLKALYREINQAIPEKYFDLVIRTDGIKFASEKSAEKFSQWLNNVGDRARQLKVVGQVEDNLQKLADRYNSTIPRFEIIFDK